METTNPETQQAVNQLYNYAADMLVNQEKSAYETKAALVEQGISMETATIVVENLESQIDEARKDQAKKDMLYGALWCIGGTALTLANVGFIFWGAILFGGIQFFKGLISANS